MATAYNFDLLDLADGESGDAAVSVVVAKKKTEAAAAKVADTADPTKPAVQEKPKFSYWTKVQLDAALKICQKEKDKLDNALKKLGDEAKKLKEQPGDEARLEEVRNQLQKLRLERIKLGEKERTTLEPDRDDFYEKNGIPLPEPRPTPDEALKKCRREQKLYNDAMFHLKVEEKKLKKQPGNEARLEEVYNEQQKLRLERIKLGEKERTTLVPERDAFYEKNEIPLPEPNPDDALEKCRREQKLYDDAMFHFEVEQTKLKEQPGNEARLEEVCNEQQKLRLERIKLGEKERTTLVPERDAFYKENEIPLPKPNPDDALEKCRREQKLYKDALKLKVDETNLKKLRLEQKKLWEEERRLLHEIDPFNNGVNGYNDEYQAQLGDGGDYYINGDRQQGYRQGQPKTRKRYVIKVKASSDAGTEAEEKPQENVVSATDTEQKEASADKADAVPASESDKSAGGAAQEGSKKKGPKNTLSGSEKRKKKNAKKNSGTEPDKVRKQDSEVDGSTDKQPLEEEQKTLAEYEKMREEKKKTLEASKTEVRKVTAEEFKDLLVLEKKKLDDEEAVIKVEKAQPKVKEASKKVEVKAEGKDAAAKDGKTKKVVPLHEICSFEQPRRFTVQEDGSSARPRFNGGFQGGRRDNSTEPRINGRAAQNEAGGHNSNGAPRGAYGAPRGGYSGGRGNGGYGYDRGHGGNQGNGGYQQQRQGGNSGQYHQQERAGNGGYQQQRNYPGSDRYYQQRGNSGDRRNFQRAPARPVLNVKDMSAFPALSAPASAGSAAPASTPAPVAAQPSAPAAAPAQAA